jgi:hypothetical protein
MQKHNGEAYQGLDHFKEEEANIRDNLEMYSNSINTYILGMGDTLNGQRFQEIILGNVSEPRSSMQSMLFTK